MLTIEQMHKQNNFILLCTAIAQKPLIDIVGIRSDGGVHMGATLC